MMRTKRAIEFYDVDTGRRMFFIDLSILALIVTISIFAFCGVFSAD